MLSGLYVLLLEGTARGVPRTDTLYRAVNYLTSAAYRFVYSFVYLYANLLS